MKTTFLSLIILMTLLGCNNDDENIPVLLLDTVSFQFSLLDDNRVDFLDPELQNTFNTDKIEYYERIDGEYRRIYKGNLDYPKKFRIFKHEEEYRFRSLVVHNGQSLYELKIDWGNGTISEIRVECIDRDGRKMANLISFDGSEVWPNALGPDLYFEVVLN